jgi:hypothetical protein
MTERMLDDLGPNAELDVIDPEPASTRPGTRTSSPAATGSIAP